MTDDARTRFLQKLEEAWRAQTLVKLTLSQPRGAEAGLRNLYGRVVELREGRRLSLLWRYATRDVTKNLPFDEALALLGKVLGHEWERAHLFTTTGDWQFRDEGGGRGLLKASRPAFTATPAPEHDREKPGLLEVAEAGWLRALGVTNTAGEARPGMAPKLRQIRRFVELLGHLVGDLAPGVVGDGGAHALQPDLPSAASGALALQPDLPSVASGALALQADLPSAASGALALQADLPSVASGALALQADLPSTASGALALQADLPSVASGALALQADLPSTASGAHALQPSSAATGSRTGQPLRVLDMGAGKGYLTFATAEFFRARGVAAEITGVEARGDLVELTNRVAREHGISGLNFVGGTIGAFTPPQPPDILIALHACDTATDDALAQGIRAGAALILAAPCCHQEVRAQMRPPPVLREVLRHGILAAREAEIVTDGLRALLLEMHGYRASVFEFISPEDTSKNLMLAAQRRAQPVDPAPLRAQYRALMEFYGLREQRLAKLLGE